MDKDKAFIDYDIAIKTLNTAFDEIKKILDIIKRLSLTSNNNWISCNDYTPQNDDWVLVTICDESGDTPLTYTSFGWCMIDSDRWIVDNEERHDVIAWMPLPSPVSYKTKPTNNSFQLLYKWISVKERVPDSSYGEVLCVNEFNLNFVGAIYECSESNTGYSAKSEGMIMHDIVAWMPIPTYEQNNID